MTEIIDGTASVAVEPYSGALLQPAAPLDTIDERFREYADLCARILDATDFQPLKVKVREQNATGQWVTRYEDKPFLKRSGWRKLATAMGVTLERLTKEVARDDEGRVVWAEFEVRATAPNGRFADGWGGCSRFERDFSKPDHDIPATAETRAYSRAAADLFGLGSLSAEEVDPGPENDAGGPGVGTGPGSAAPSERELRRLHVAVRDLAAAAPDWSADDLRHRIISNATGGRIASAKDLTAADMGRVWDEIEAAKAALGA